MKSGQGSRTADGAAAFRASHYLYAQDRVFEDPFAMAMTSKGWQAVLSSRIANDLMFRWLLRGMAPVATQVLARSRFAEDVLARSVESGIQQYVIVGAGLDSFALRQRSASAALRIFELDHPATQSSKRQRLSALGMALPQNLEFVAVDFERQELFAALQASSYRADRPAVFSWLGTTHYLTPQATLGTLRSIAQHATRGSEVVVDYSLPKDLIARNRRTALVWLSMLAARLGEPIIGQLIPNELHAQVESLGFEIVEDISADEQALRYFANRTDGLAPPAGCQLLHLRLRRPDTAGSG